MKEIALKDFVSFLSPRPKHSHKGDFGHVLIIGGDCGYSGAIRLAAEAALRVGAGLVSVATHPAHAALINASRPEIMSHPVDSAGGLSPLLVKATTLVIGPGLGLGAWGRSLWEAAITVDKPVVVDADALHLLAQQKIKKSNWILTPHPGEAASLLNCSVDALQQGRVASIQQLHQKYGGIIVLKGAGSLVLGDSHELAICQAGNPGMATGGMGDVLSGVIAALVAQRIPLETAAKLGVLLHALAGDEAAKMGERGMIASDLFPHLYKLVNIEHG